MHIILFVSTFIMKIFGIIEFFSYLKLENNLNIEENLLNQMIEEERNPKKDEKKLKDLEDKYVAFMEKANP